MGIQFFGKHLIVDFKEGDLEVMNDPKKIKNFVQYLVETIDMTPYGDCFCEKFGDTDEVAGYSFYQMIEESNISGHLCSYDFIMTDGTNNKGAGYIDIFSCKHFNENLAIEIIQKHFKPKSYTQKVLMRK